MKHPSPAPLPGSTIMFGGPVQLPSALPVWLSVALVLTVLSLAQVPASATTYYIDYETGSDSNRGTSKPSPWKRHPYMQGFEGNYSHTGGDQFIFRGGVVWPVTCFQLRIATGGVTDSTRDYYGTDPTWYAGSSFTRALFDFQNTRIDSGFAGSGIHITASFINFGDGLDLARHRADSVYGGMTISAYGNVNQVKLTNCVVRDWSLALPVAVGQDGGGGFGYFGGGTGSNLEVDHCTFHQVNSATINGTAILNIGTCKSTEVYHTASALHGSGDIHDNSIHDLLNTSDSAQHTDAIITYSQSTIYNNLIYNLVGRCAPIELCAPSVAAVTGYDTVYNNIVYNPGAQPPLWTKVDNGNYAAYGLVAYNNLFEHGSSYCIIIEAGFKGAVFGSLNTHDNVFITTGPGIVYGGNYHSAQIASVLSSHDTVIGRLAGYSASNNYNPERTRGPVGSFGAWGVGTVSGITHMSVVLNSPTANSAVSGFVTLSASALPSSTGAAVPTVQFLVDGSPVGSANSTSGAFSFAWDSHTVGNSKHDLSVVATDSGGSQASSTAVSVTVANETTSASPGASPWLASAGAINAPFFIKTGGNVVYVAQTQSTGPSDGGRDVYSFDTSAAATYSVKATINSADQDHNSFYVTMETDGLPTEANVWDLPITGGAWQAATVSWRGNGNNTTPQFPVKTWSIAPGHHTLAFIGREAGTMLQQVSLVAMPATSTLSLSVDLNSPASGTTLVGMISLSATALSASTGSAVTAVQFLVDGTQVGNGAASGRSYSVAWDSRSVADGVHSISATATDSSGAQASSASASVRVANMTWQANAGSILGPFLLTSDSAVVYVAQSISTGPADGGRAIYGFDTTVSGAYTVSATINTADQDHNSFYLTMETDGPATEANVWDLPVTGGVWQTAIVSWRGVGNNLTPQFPVKTWSIAPGHHTLTFVGREAGTKLGNIAVVRTPAPPANLRIITP